ncbi:WD repeat domain-containing protein [Colletotrichum higginsianum]|nr:WD repeat domain-containing protein [Colletotrichum higginsianum]
MTLCPVSSGNSLPMICLGRISQVFYAEFFDVKFCPYQPLDASPIFAAVSKKHAEARNYYCTWTRDAETGKPLLCYGGEDAKIKIYDIVESKLVNLATEE